MVPGQSSRCIWKWRPRRTRRWLRTGKRMPMASLYSCVSSNLVLHINSMVVDWSIFRCCRILDLSVDSGHSTKPTGHVQFLPRQYISGYDQPKCIRHSTHFPTPILSTKSCSLGECTVVHDLGYQPYLCPASDPSAAMGTKIPQSHAVTLQSTQASTDPFVLFRRRREVSPTLGSRNIAHASPHLPVPVLRRPRCVPMQCQYDGFQVGIVMGRRLHGSVWLHHADADLSSR